MQSPIIGINRITKTFGGVTALNDVRFDIAAGSLHAIVGENGAGKSTLMKILSGVITDYDGDILFSGNRVHFSGTREAEAAGISIIHQELNLVDELTAAANVFLGRERRNRLGLVDDREMLRRAGEIFADLGCDIPAGALVRELRVGDQQLVEIAKALSISSDILIMDEPTSALTEGETERLFRVIDRLRQRGTTILYISHKLDEVFRLADVITVLRDGTHVVTHQRTETNRRDVTHLMVGREIEQHATKEGRSPGPVVLSVNKMKLPDPTGARAWRLEDISFELHRGEVLGVAGLMGAGRTELLEALFGVSKEAPRGLIELEGRPVHFRHPRQAVRAGLALVTEDRKRLGLFPQLSVRENITVCTLADVARGGIVSRKREVRGAREAAGELGVKSDGLEAGIGSLSGGNQQKCIIARWLKTTPKVLLLDDPTRGIDVGAKAEIYKVIDTLCAAGMGILITSSELPELLHLCDRILVLCEGRLTGRFSREQFSEAAIMEAATDRDRELAVG